MALTRKPLKKSAPKKKKADSISKLIKKFDEVFSKYIRLRDAMPQNGLCRCISCGRLHHWTEIQNGHYMSRRYMSTRFSESNCHSQCVACNIFNQGNIQMYRRGLVKLYGEQAVSELEVRARVETKKWSSWELEQMIKYYNARIEQLKIEKGL